MLPFIYIFGNAVPMYGIMMMTGAVLAVLFACLRARKRGLDPLDVVMASIFCLIVGLLGAKFLFILTDIPNMVAYFNLHEFSFSWLIDRIARSGIVFYGGLIGGFLGGWLYCHLFRLNFWKHADTMIPFLPIAHGFGRIGCFCAGCCFGRQAAPPWGIAFTHAIGAPNGVPLLPVQLFEAVFNIALLFPLLFFYSRKDRKPGQVVGLYLICYGVFRYINEFLRSDDIRGIFAGVTTSQWISLILVPIGILLVSGVASRLLEKLNRKRFEFGRDDIDFNEYEAGESDCAVCTECGECGKKGASNEEAEQSAGQEDVDNIQGCLNDK